MARNTDKVKSDVLITLELCRQLELKVYLVKSEFTPTHEFVFLVYHYKLACGMVCPPSRRVEDLRAVIGETLSYSLSLGHQTSTARGSRAGVWLCQPATAPNPF